MFFIKLILNFRVTTAQITQLLILTGFLAKGEEQICQNPLKIDRQTIPPEKGLESLCRILFIASMKNIHIKRIDQLTNQKLRNRIRFVYIVTHS